jgi:class 3 adenylate cyclase
VVGDAVNAAARIERLTAEYGTPLLFSADVLAAAPELAQDLRLAPPLSCVLRGRTKPIELYRVMATPREVIEAAPFSAIGVRNSRVTLQ